MEEEDKENEDESVVTANWKEAELHDESSNASSTSSTALEIVTGTQKATTSKSCKKRKIINMPEELENLEEEIEEQLASKAKKSHMTVANVKNILRHVITNQHVMAMVKKSMKDCGEVGSSDEEFPYEPKLTRAKTKELLQTHTGSNIPIPWPVTPTKPPPVSETKILIDAVLPDEEDDDEEYQPAEEEEVERIEKTSKALLSKRSDDVGENLPSTSDDEGSSLASDLEAVLTPQPATPRSNADCSTQTTWTEDGLFKVPQQSNGMEHESLESIGQRTRSKLSLSNTDLETIEQSFVPPDITTDMYDLECDNEDWRNFLTEFTKPLNTVANETIDDDEADPEYNILEDEEAEDKEELRADRAVKVSKKELNELIAELMEFMESSDEEAEPGNDSLNSTMQLSVSQYSTPTDQSIPNVNSTGECSFASLRLPNQQSTTTCIEAAQKPINSSVHTSAAQTPSNSSVHMSAAQTHSNSFMHMSAAQTHSNSFMHISAAQKPSPPITLATPSHGGLAMLTFPSTSNTPQFQLQTPSKPITAFLGSIPIVATLQPMSPVVVQPMNPIVVHSMSRATAVQPVPLTIGQPISMPTVTVQSVHATTVQPVHATTIQPAIATAVRPVPATTVQPSISTADQPVHATTVERRVCVQKSTNPAKDGEHNNEYILPDSLPVQQGENEKEFVLPDRIVRMTTNVKILLSRGQRLLLAQHMRQHVQLLAQSYMQSIIIPEMHCCSLEIKENLLSLKYLKGSNQNSAFCVDNLDDAIEAVNTWDSYLEDNNPKSKEIKKFTDDERKRMEIVLKKRQLFEPKHSPLFLELVSHNPAFMYPLLLPKVAFKFKKEKSSKLYFTKSETILLTYGLAQFMPLIERTQELHSKKKPITMETVSDLISELILPAKTSKTIQHHIARLKSVKYEENPIQNFFLKKIIPLTDHYVIACKPTPPTQQPTELLPPVFRRYLYGEDSTDAGDG